MRASRFAIAVFAIAAASCGRGSPLYGGGSPTTGSSTTGSSTTGSSTTGSTGVHGRVTAGPTCPVERPDQPCPPQPVHGDVEATAANGQRAGSTTTDADGRYALALRPGDYTLHVVTDGPFPRCGDVPVTVTTGPPATADITCDTGIR